MKLIRTLLLAVVVVVPTAASATSYHCVDVNKGYFDCSKTYFGRVESVASCSDGSNDGPYEVVMVRALNEVEEGYYGCSIRDCIKVEANPCDQGDPKYSIIRHEHDASGNIVNITVFGPESFANSCGAGYCANQ